MSSDVPFVGFDSNSGSPQYAVCSDTAPDAAPERLSMLSLQDRLRSAPRERDAPHRRLIDPQIHRCAEQLILVKRGGGIMTLEGHDCAFGGPALLVIPSQTLHGFVYEPDTEGWVVTLAKSYFQEVMTRTPEFAEVFAAGNCIAFGEQEREFLEMERVASKLEWEQRRSARCRDIATEALLIDLLVGVLRNVQHGQAPRVADNGSYQEAYRRFVSMVEEHHRENWSLQRFAEALRTSVPRLRAICRCVTGESPIRIINERIALEAKRCLTYTSLSVSEIAYRLGFDDPSYFSRFFKSRCRQTPTEYREARKGVRRASRMERVE